MTSLPAPAFIVTFSPPLEIESVPAPPKIETLSLVFETESLPAPASIVIFFPPLEIESAPVPP